MTDDKYASVESSLRSLRECVQTVNSFDEGVAVGGSYYAPRLKSGKKKV